MGQKQAFQQPGIAVEVVLATFNGAAHLEELLASLAAQTMPPALLRVSDDGSSDSTRAVVERWRNLLPLRWLDASPGMGACGNFARLLESSEADYVMLADQDDIWDSDKIESAMREMTALEARWGREAAILVHGDLRLVDATAKMFAPSFLRFQHLDAAAVTLDCLLLQNVVTGCTVLMNRALLREALPIPQGAAMHDWWLALVASAFGHIGFVPRPTISYRQHEANHVGAQGWSVLYIVRRLRGLLARRSAGALLRPCIEQARVFEQRYGSRVRGRHAATLHWLASLPENGGIKRITRALRVRAGKHGIARTLALYWALLLGKFDS